MIASLMLASYLGVAQPPTVDLSRLFKKGQTFNYQVRTRMMIEQRGGELNTFIPEDVDLNYDFSKVVEDVKPSGFASIIYRRPTMTIIEGETADSPPKTVVERVNINYRLDLSPINEIGAVRNLNPPSQAAGGGSSRLMSAAPLASASQVDIIGQFAGELQRLALFVGSFDSALDFNPKLPFEEARVGETWKRTVSYQPQVMSGTRNQMAMQRLDMTYKYEGLVQSEGKEVHRISATVKLDSDAGTFLNQMMGMSPEQSGLNRIPLKLDTQIEFDLDKDTRHTIRAVARTNSSWSVMLSGMTRPAVEQRITGRATMRLVSLK